jgi:hypothetical protein
MTAKRIDLTNEWDRDKLRNWMTNAKRRGRDDVYQDAFRQLCRIDGRDLDDPLAAEFAGAMCALEEALTQAAGKTRRLSRTRQKLKRVGVRQTLADLTLNPQPSIGFLKLVEFGMADMSAEWLVLKYRDEFSREVIAAARQRLEKYNVGFEGVG